MPPCAAIECARRGLSWKQKQCTLWPCCPSDAPAEAPASPEPTMITVCLRRLAGLTSFISKRALSHFSSIGPDGILDSSISLPSAHPAREHRNRHRDKTSEGDHSHSPGSGSQTFCVVQIDPAQRLQHAPNPMIEMKAQGAHGNDVEQRDRQIRKPGYYILIHHQMFKLARL